MRVSKVEYVKGYKLKVFFNDHSVKIVDLENMIKESRGIFLPLKDVEYFKKVTLDDCQLSICWPNGADVCPDVLYQMGEDIGAAKSVKSQGRSRQGRISNSVAARTKRTSS